MAYSTQGGFHLHGNCAYFRNGLCILNGVPVDASGAGCTNFTPKSMIASSPAARTHLRSRSIHPREAVRGYRPPVFPPLPPPKARYGYSLTTRYPPWKMYRPVRRAPRYRIRYGYSFQYRYRPQPVWSYRLRYGFRHFPPVPTAVMINGPLLAPASPEASVGIGTGGSRLGSRVYVGKGRRRMGGSAGGSEGSCVCPTCGYIAPRMRGTTCDQRTCPRCGNNLTGGIPA